MPEKQSPASSLSRFSFWRTFFHACGGAWGGAARLARGERGALRIARPRKNPGLLQNRWSNHLWSGSSFLCPKKWKSRLRRTCHSWYNKLCQVKYQKNYTEFNETYHLVLPLSLEGFVPDDDSPSSQCCNGSRNYRTESVCPLHCWLSSMHHNRIHNNRR